MSYTELRGFAALNSDIKTNSENYSQDILVAYALVEVRFNEWLLARGYDKVDPEAPAETILAQMTLQTIENQWADAGTDLLRIKQLQADADLDSQE